MSAARGVGPIHRGPGGGQGRRRSAPGLRGHGAATTQDGGDHVERSHVRFAGGGIRRRFLRALPALLLACIVPIAPAAAGTRWTAPQVVDGEPGTGIVMSANGRVAAWIGGLQADTGPVRCARYFPAERRWHACAAPPGVTGASQVRLTPDGASVLIEVPGSGYLLSSRVSANVWGQPRLVAAGAHLAYGQVSADGNTLVWVDWSQTQTDPKAAGQVLMALRTSDGGWGTPVLLGLLSEMYEDYGELPIVMSASGSTLAWVDPSGALKVYDRNDDGTWATPTTIARYKFLPYVESLSFNADGTRLMWTVVDTDGVFTTSRSSGRWSGADYVSTDEALGAVMAPSGALIAFSSYAADSVFAKRFTDGRWTRARRLGRGSEESVIAVGRNTVVWAMTDRTRPRAALWAATWRGGQWRKATRLSVGAVGPVLSQSGDCLLYTDPRRDAVLATRH